MDPNQVRLLDRLIIDRLHNGHPVPWDDLSDGDAERIDNELGIKAGEYIDANDSVRAMIFLREREKYHGRRTVC